MSGRQSESYLLPETVFATVTVKSFVLTRLPFSFSPFCFANFFFAAQTKERKKKEVV